MSNQLELFQKKYKKWNNEIKSSKERDFDFDTLSGESQDPCYFPSNPSNDYLEKLGFPGQFPFTRGIHSNLYRGKLWTMRQFAGFGTPKETNKRFKQLLKKGQLLKVKPSMAGLRARIKDQDIKLLAQNQEDIAIEVCQLKDKIDGFETRTIEKFNHFERVIDALKAVIVCWDDNQDD